MIYYIDLAPSISWNFPQGSKELLAMQAWKCNAMCHSGKIYILTRETNS